MTQAFLQSELTSLISDSKRKHNDVRTAAEQSLTDLRGISVTSETQLAGDLLRRQQFIDPFVLACKSKNLKLVSNGTVCLQRLTASKAIARPRLPDLLEAFQDAVSTGYEPQLKILQTLPSLLQLYASDIHGDLLARTLEICVALQSSKNPIVNNTAAATFQQLITTVFDQAQRGQREQDLQQSDALENREDNDDYGDSSSDAIRLFDDFCLLLDQHPARFLKLQALASEFLLETIQTILFSYGSFILSRPTQVEICREHLLAGLTRQIARKDAFTTMVRSLAILSLMIKTSADLFKDQLPEIFMILMNAIDKDGSQPWRRALSLEFFRETFADFVVLRRLFELFDNVGEVKIVGQILAAFVRIASEDPSLIGLGRQSTVPLHRTNDSASEEAASIEAQGLGGAITTVSSADTTTTGISVEWSVITTPLLQQPEKHNPPSIPSTYVYTLALECTASFCDGLSKFIMPLSVPNRNVLRQSAEESRRDSISKDNAGDEPTRKPSRSSTSSQKYQRLINPLNLSKRPLLAQVQLCAAMIESCWPAALATCSTFLNAALDSEFYHILIRSVQKLAQVSGVLELSTPRDALLTTLAKASVPANASSVVAAYQNSKRGIVATSDHNDNQEPTPKSLQEPSQSSGFQISSPPLNVRHLLCLRALLNLGIALGPTLEQETWFILVETVQQVEALMSIPIVGTAISHAGTPKIGTTGEESQTTLAGEIAAVQAATKRMLESTRGYSDSAFTAIVNALFRLLRTNEPDTPSITSPVTSPGPATKSGTSRPMGHSSRSMSSLWTRSRSIGMEIEFVLNKISELSRVNLLRFATVDEHESSWDLIGSRLLSLCQDRTLLGDHRIQAASILDLISMETVKVLDDPRYDGGEAETVRGWCLQALSNQLKDLDLVSANRASDADFEIHKRLMEALESIVSHSGESLNENWPAALDIIAQSFSMVDDGTSKTQPPRISDDDNEDERAHILRVQFRTVQLMTSDFLGVLSSTSLASIARLLRQFGSQTYDLNIALTSTTLLWSLASQTLDRAEQIDITHGETDQSTETSVEEVTTTESLWALTLSQLVGLCKDDRPDVRNAAIRILTKTLDASSESLTPNTWAAILEIGPLSAIRYCVEQYSTNYDEQEQWMLSMEQLTEGVTQIISQNLPVIGEHKSFEETWAAIMSVFESVLQTPSLTAATLAFSNIHRLLSVIPSLRRVDGPLVVPTLRLWATYHPADLASDENSPNQPAFTAHAHTLVVAFKTSSQAVSKYRHDGKSMDILLREATQKTILSASHPPYTSDVKEPASEQREVIECLGILKAILQTDATGYSEHILELLRLMLGIENGKVIKNHKKAAMTKSFQRPTFTAFASACIDNIRLLVLENASRGELVAHLPIGATFEILSATIGTKYTSIPTNNQAPLWRNATVTAVVILEAITTESKSHGTAEQDGSLSTISEPLIGLSQNMLGPGGLTGTEARYKEETLIEDETFDIEHFQLLHRNIVTLSQSDRLTAQTCRRYAVSVFNASLLAKPWFNDMPEDLEKTPLQGLFILRAGSVHRPVFPSRRRICYAALDALFSLVRQKEVNATSNEQPRPSQTLSENAAPYLLLRVVHPIKTFLSDQRLRGLTPPPVAQQAELHTILSKFVDLRSNGRALLAATAAGKLGGDQGRVLGQRGTVEDGKEHLRILYPLLLQVSKFWRDLPRLSGEGAWQADEAGRGIEVALEKWTASISEGW
ncbi:hypothetical protein PV10_08090 [Exophiala mesophila]|uniref:Protein MON2 homolog n=1 Tax=Exophiala mesophila TaxID=212818 RepID=A0A0D1WHW2_EXOME|nr:uncharacterized protein PV10_08090 [Exophiala mesophila]KIV88405.1 hypothetical protein PV10_08090 [Exophiala mesophila]